MRDAKRGVQVVARLMSVLESREYGATREA